MKAPLRTAVVGVGHLGKEHARILAGLPDVELVGVADVNSDQAEAVARKVGSRGFAGHRPLLHLAEAAVIAVPTLYHFAVAGEFLRCGIPVLVEKPLASNLAQAEELVDLARRHGALLQVGHIERFNPAFEKLQRFALQPKFVRSERLGPFSGRSTDIGVVLDLMIHDLDVLRALVAGPATSVDAVGVSVFGGKEDVADARIHFADGCVAHLSASRASYAVERKTQVWGPEGCAVVDFGKRSLTLVQPSEAVRRHGLDLGRLDPASRATFKDQLFTRHLETLTLDCNRVGPDALTRELQDFVHCVQTGSHPRVTGEDGRDAIALASLVLERIARHAWTSDPDGPVGPSHLPPPAARLFGTVSGDLAA